MRRPLLASLIALLLVLAAAPAALAEEGEGRGKGKVRSADFAKRGDKWVLHNDHIAVWFHQGKEKAKPDLRVALNGSDDEDAGYRVKLLRICEVPANATQCTGDLPRVNLARANDWNVVMEEGNESLTIRMTLSDAQAIVTLVWHLNTTSAAVKFDVQVQNWAWENESDRLALDLLVVGRNLGNETGAGRVCAASASSEASSCGANVSVEDAGYISWATTAAATYADGNATTLNVTASVRSDGEEGDEPGSHLVLVFDGAGGYRALDYDPTLGVMGSSASGVGLVPALGIAAGIAVVAVAALVLRRRRA